MVVVTVCGVKLQVLSQPIVRPFGLVGCETTSAVLRKRPPPLVSLQITLKSIVVSTPLIAKDAVWVGQVYTGADVIKPKTSADEVALVPPEVCTVTS